MQLHQLLRFILPGTCVAIFDIDGQLLVKVKDKSQISLDWYEYDIFDLSCVSLAESYNTKINNSYLAITLIR